MDPTGITLTEVEQSTYTSLWQTVEVEVQLALPSVDIFLACVTLTFTALLTLSECVSSAPHWAPLTL